jgi:hypothetical protein
MLTLALLLAASGAGAPRALTATDRQHSVPDSISLERTHCYGNCPVYRLTVTSAGVVRFQNLDAKDPARAQDSVARSVFVALAAHANSIGFSSYPDTLRNDPRFCARWMTDASSAIITTYAGRTTKIVYDYEGCLDSQRIASFPRIAGAPPQVLNAEDAALLRLRAFERAFDSALVSARWVRPSHFMGRPGQLPKRTADSIVLVRRPSGWGPWPWSRVSVTAAGSVRVQASFDGKDTVTGRDSIPPAKFALMIERADGIGFFTMPASHMKVLAYCGEFAMDVATATITIYDGATSKVVADDVACVGATYQTTIALAKLRTFQNEIDETLGSARWVKRPPR